MNKATKGMGTGGLSKHRKAGKAPKSPKLRHQMMLDAQKNEVKRKEYPMVSSFRALFGRKPNEK